MLSLEILFLFSFVTSLAILIAVLISSRKVGQICGALRAIKIQRGKLDPCLYLSLLYLGKIRPSLMALEPVPQALCSLLRRDVTVGMKNKSNPLVPILVTGLLMRAFNENKHWPDTFVKVCSSHLYLSFIFSCVFFFHK